MTKEKIEQLAEIYYPPYPDGVVTNEIRALREGFIKGCSFTNYCTQCQTDKTTYFTEETWNTMCSRISELQSELKDKKWK